MTIYIDFANCKFEAWCYDDDTGQRRWLAAEADRARCHEQAVRRSGYRIDEIDFKYTEECRLRIWAAMRAKESLSQLVRVKRPARRRGDGTCIAQQTPIHGENRLRRRRDHGAGWCDATGDQGIVSL